MDVFNNLVLGFTVATAGANLLYCFVGVFIGTLVGVLPGIGPVTAMGILLSLTFNLPPVSALIMLAGIFYGASYGGSTTAILVNLPGEPASVVTCIEGHAMALQGRVGPALVIVALGSFFAGTVCTLMIALVGPALAAIVLEFGSPEYFSLMLMGLVCAAVLAKGSLPKSLAMVTLGLLLGIVGTDVNSGLPRFTTEAAALADGIGFAVIAMGVFGLAEVINYLGQGTIDRGSVTEKISRLWPTRSEFRRSVGPVLRGTAIGAFFGPLPGGGATIASFASYPLEKKLSGEPSNFGRGAIEGVAGPEAANNAATQTAFIPTLTLGIPASASMALMLGAMTIHGITPGPQVMSARPDLFWGLIASMWIGNAMLLCLNLPLIGIWVRLLKVPYRVLFPIITGLMAIGVYTLSSAAFDVYLMALFGLLGYIWLKLKCDAAPLLLAFVVGPLMEENLRRALLISRGHFDVFFTRPISATFMLGSGLLLLTVIVPMFRRKAASVPEEPIQSQTPPRKVTSDPLQWRRGGR
jgi:putative tricarboxylic transport membrane protein